MAGESKTNVYVFDHYIAQFVDGIDAGTHHQAGSGEGVGLVEPVDGGVGAPFGPGLPHTLDHAGDDRRFRRLGRRHHDGFWLGFGLWLGFRFRLERLFGDACQAHGCYQGQQLTHGAADKDAKTRLQEYLQGRNHLRVRLLFLLLWPDQQEIERDKDDG